MRTEGRFFFKCTMCGEKLGMTEGAVNYHSAFDITYTVNVIPCKGCIAKITEPAQRLRDAIKGIE